MPTKELKKEIGNQKMLFELQHQKETVKESENINTDLSFTDESVFNPVKENNKKKILTLHLN